MIRHKIEGHTSMIPPRDTSTIRVRHQIHHDLVRRKEWPLLDSADPDLPVFVSEVVFSSAYSDLPILRPTANKGMANRIVALSRQLGFPAYALFLTMAEQPNSAIIRHRRIWGLPALRAIQANIHTWPETILDCRSGLRMGALAKVPSAHVLPTLSLELAYVDVIALLLPGEVDVDADLSRRLLLDCFPPDGCGKRSDPDWGRLVSAIVRAHGVVVRCYDLFEPEVTAYFFGPEAISAKIESATTMDDDQESVFPLN